MDVVRFMGGLGNQMFQYAFLEALRHRGRKAAADLSWYKRQAADRPFLLDKIFEGVTIEGIENYVLKENDRIYPHEVYEEKSSGIFDSGVFEMSDRTFIGYWQTEKYFKELDEKIRKKYRFIVRDSKLVELGNSIQGNTFSMHVRRGDYLANDVRIALYGCVCRMDYYHDAMTYIRGHVQKPQFIVFSDDIEWVRKQFKDEGDVLVFDKEIFDGYEDWYDMYLMTRCRGNILANSSFSWWGAWLNQNNRKIVIAPKVWLNGYDTSDIWCDGWTRI